MQNPDTAHPPSVPTPAFGGRIIVPRTGHRTHRVSLDRAELRRRAARNPAGIPTQHRGRRRNPFRPRVGFRVGRASRRGGGGHSPAVLGAAFGLVSGRLRPGLLGHGHLAGVPAAPRWHGGGGKSPIPFGTCPRPRHCPTTSPSVAGSCWPPTVSGAAWAMLSDLWPPARSWPS